MAEKLAIKGVDISAWQKGISFAALKEAGVKFVIIRAVCGSKKDTQLDKFVDECKKYGFKFGFYLYTYSTDVAGAKRDAANCIAAIKQYKPDYPVYWDMEDKSQINGLTSKLRTDMAIAFCEAIRAAGFTPGIYANPSWLLNFYERERLVGKYPVWLAHWTESPDKPSKYDFKQEIHQWGVDRIGGYNVDGDIAYVDYSLGAQASEPEEVNGYTVTINTFGTREAAEKFAAEQKNKGLSVEIDETEPKTPRELAGEVWAGRWGAGETRKKLLADAGYDYKTVQEAVNNYK